MRLGTPSIRASEREPGALRVSATAELAGGAVDRLWFDFPERVRPWLSDSTSGTRIVHHGADASRVEKTALVAASP